MLAIFLLGAPPLMADKSSIINLNTGTRYRDLQQAIDGASYGDTIKLSGLFKGSFKINGKSLNITGPSETNDFATLDGGQGARPLEIAGVYPLTNGSNPITVNLNNLIIQNGSADHGGGIFNANAQLNLSNVVLYNNHAATKGGGIASFNGTVELNSSTIIYNQASSAGGIDVTNGTLWVNGSNISNNKATQFGGGGIVTTSTNSTIQQSNLLGNSAGSYGGAIDNETNSVMSVYQCTIFGNQAPIGAGFYNNATLTVNQSSIYENSAAQQGGGLYQTEDAVETTLINCSVLFNSANSQGGEVGGGILNLGSNNSLQLDNVNLILNSPDNIAPELD